MPSGDHSVVRARPPRGKAARVRRRDDPDTLAAYLRDAAHYPGGHSPEIYFPESEADVAAVMRAAPRVLTIGAQSSLTGGATPFGDTLLSTTRMQRVLDWTESTITVEPGLDLARLEVELAARGRYYPPVPTYDGATIGGTVATNAGGAATFKHGTTRAWVQALTVVLANGEALDLRRGDVRAGPDGSFTIVGLDGTTRTVRVPAYRTPDLPKVSAGYFARPGMDLIDLFIGSEGTLGIVTSIELRLVRERPAWLVALAPVSDDAAALTLVASLREASQRTRHKGEARGIDVAAIEYLDARCLALLREDAIPSRLGVPLPAAAGAAILFQIELPPGTSSDDAALALATTTTGEAAALTRLARLLDDHAVLTTTIPALPDDAARRRALFALREAVPEGVNRRIGTLQRSADPSISKSASDVIVPFERLGEALAAYRAIFEERALDHAIWGHVSDGNLHPNVIPTSRADMERARDAQLAIGQTAIDLGGCPMAEHGTGRNPVKKALLERFYGRDGIAAMRQVKRALDPTGKLAPGVLFDA